MAIGAETRIWARAVFACVLAIALLIPSIDTCAADFNLGNASQAAVALPAVSQVDNLSGESSKGTPCHYCHCSHPVGLVRAERTVLGAAVSDAKLGWVPPDALHAAPAFTLLRPPRA